MAANKYKTNCELFNIAITRFWNNVSKTNYCWNWNGNINSRGYGTIKAGRKQYTTHRFSYLLKYKKLPSSKMDIMHLCDNKKCVNPDHLKIGTRHENMIDYVMKGGKYGTVGENNQNSKLTNKQYEKIKQRIKNGETISSLSKEYNITAQSISSRIRRENGTFNKKNRVA